jgi:hypothetical protein
MEREREQISGENDGKLMCLFNNVSPVAICVEECILIPIQTESIEEVDMFCFLDSQRGSFQCLGIEIERIKIMCEGS